jgi:hypothetical protein
LRLPEPLVWIKRGPSAVPMATADILRGVQDSKAGSEQLMADFPVTSGGAESAGVAEPTITAHLDHIVTGAGFLPNCSVTVRVTYGADQASDYLAFSADMCGWLYAELPSALPTASYVSLPPITAQTRAGATGCCGATPRSCPHRRDGRPAILVAGPIERSRSP